MNVNFFLPWERNVENSVTGRSLWLSNLQIYLTFQREPGEERSLILRWLIIF